MKNAVALSAAAIALLMTPVASAYAATVVLLNPQVASAVNDLIVDGTTYDVRFIWQGTDTTFAGNTSGALAAANALDAALNGSTASFVNAIGGGSVNSFDVQDNGVNGVVASSFSTAGNWQVISTNSVNGSVAVFTAVPESSTWAMMLIGFATLGFAAHRGRRNRLAAAFS